MMPKSVEIGEFVMWGYHFGLLGRLGLLGQLGRLGGLSRWNKKCVFLRFWDFGRTCLGVAERLLILGFGKQTKKCTIFKILRWSGDIRIADLRAEDLGI